MGDRIWNPKAIAIALTMVWAFLGCGSRKEALIAPHGLVALLDRWEQANSTLAVETGQPTAESKPTEPAQTTQDAQAARAEWRDEGQEDGPARGGTEAYPSSSETSLLPPLPQDDIKLDEESQEGTTDLEPRAPAPASILDLNDNVPFERNAEGLTLDQTINVVLLADPELRVGFEAINQANAEALTAFLAPNPTISVNQSLLPLVRPFTEDRQGGPPQLDVGVEYPIDWFVFGKRAAALQAATLNTQISEAEYADLVRRRVLDATILYYDVLEAEALRDLARQDVRNFQTVETITRRAVQAGGRPRVELDRVRLERLRSEQTLREAQRQLVASLAALGERLGATQDTPPLQLAGTLDTIEPILTPPSVREGFELAFRMRPDLEAARLKITQADAELLAETRNALPELVTRFGYTRQFQRRAIGFPDADSWGIGLDFTLPLFNRNQGQRARAASVVVQSQAELRAALVGLYAELVEADQALRTAAENVRAVAQDQLELATRVRDTLTQAYQEGGRPLLDVVDAQRDFRETTRLFIESRADYARALARYNATLGTRLSP